jgi:hypothetical protein
VCGSGNYDRKKKDTVVCLTGCAVVLFFVVAGNFDYDRKKKIQSSVGGKLAVFLLWWEIFITTGKKMFQSSVWRVCQFLILAGNWQFFCCGGKFSLRPEKKKVPVVCLAGVSVFGPNPNPNSF